MTSSQIAYVQGSPYGHRNWIVTAYAISAMMLIAAGYYDDIGPVAVAAMTTAVVVLAGLANFFWPSLERDPENAPMACLIAFIGCDGSGKSSLTTDLENVFRSVGKIAHCYLGLGSGTLGGKIERWPLVGRLFGRKLAKAALSRTRDEAAPGFVTALVIYVFALIRLHRFRKMLRLRRAGYVVLTDQYPQTECSGCYDGPGLSGVPLKGWLVPALARQELRLYEYMASFRPDVVIRLHVDLETAMARRPDHRRDRLEKMVSLEGTLLFGGAKTVDLDATQPYRLVLAEASQIVRQFASVQATLRMPQTWFA